MPSYYVKKAICSLISSYFCEFITLLWWRRISIALNDVIYPLLYTKSLVSFFLAVCKGRLCNLSCSIPVNGLLMILKTRVSN